MMLLEYVCNASLLYDILASKDYFTNLNKVVTLRLRIIPGPQFIFYLIDQPIYLKQIVDDVRSSSVFTPQPNQTRINQLDRT